MRYNPGFSQTSIYISSDSEVVDIERSLFQAEVFHLVKGFDDFLDILNAFRIHDILCNLRGQRYRARDIRPRVAYQGQLTLSERKSVYQL